jgi:hypothetical protein
MSAPLNKYESDPRQSTSFIKPLYKPYWGSFPLVHSIGILKGMATLKEYFQKGPFDPWKEWFAVRAHRRRCVHPWRGGSQKAVHGRDVSFNFKVSRFIVGILQKGMFAKEAHGRVIPEGEVLKFTEKVKF